MEEHLGVQAVAEQQAEYTEVLPQMDVLHDLEAYILVPREGAGCRSERGAVGAELPVVPAALLVAVKYLVQISWLEQNCQHLLCWQNLSHKLDVDLAIGGM